MSNSLPSENAQVLRFANEARMRKKALTARSFCYFFECQLQCVEDVFARNSLECFKTCQNGRSRTCCSLSRPGRPRAIS